MSSSTPISHYLTSISLTPRALAKRAPLRYSDNAKIRALLAKPSWSVRRRLLPSDKTSSRDDTQVSVSTLRHLLRLSALPAPAADSGEEQTMLRDLHSQIRFVQQMSDVDVDVDAVKVEPLVGIRDEGEAAVGEARVGLADAEVRAALADEVVVGRGGEFERRMRRRRRGEGEVEREGEGGDTSNGLQGQPAIMDWDPFALGVGSESSARRAGRWFVVKKKGRSRGDEQQQQQQQQHQQQQ